LLSALLLSGASCSSGDLGVGTRDAVSAAGGVGARATNRVASIPIGIENVNNSPMKAANYRALLRFVPDRTLSIDRVYFGFNLQGASCWDPGAATDGSGDGGVLDASVVTIDRATGLPGAVIATETVSACARHQEASAEVGGNSDPVLVWVNVNLTLEGGTMYALVVNNADANPASNYFSFHMPIADAALAGPQARNELDMNAAGGIMSLDPREHVAWSEDAGVTWRYGTENGQYPSYMNDNDTAHPATRVPQYGFRRTDSTNMSPQPYYAYRTVCASCSVEYANAKYARSFSLLGGFTASGTDVGTLTLLNLATGAGSSCTPAQGYGFRTCTLQAPVAVAAGESYSVSSSGSVELMRMDNAQRVMFPSIGTSDGELCAYQSDPAPGTNAKDVPSLWAGPLSANFPGVGEN
jgi:hypothetical protein